VFIGYFSSFFIALLLSLFYLGCAGSGIFDRVRKEEIIEKPDEASCCSIVTVRNAEAISHFTFDCVADVPGRNCLRVFSRPIIDAVFVDHHISILEVCLSEYFPRPPPIL
jgi:hypothetical protein